MSDVITYGRRTTRKPHRCLYCDQTIPVGASVPWWTWKDGDRLGTSRAHDECSRAAHWEMREYGLAEDDPNDPDEFRRETLPAYREHVRTKATDERTTR